MRRDRRPSAIGGRANTAIPLRCLLTLSVPGLAGNHANPDPVAKPRAASRWADARDDAAVIDRLMALNSTGAQAVTATRFERHGT